MVDIVRSLGTWAVEPLGNSSVGNLVAATGSDGQLAVGVGGSEVASLLGVVLGGLVGDARAQVSNGGETRRVEIGVDKVAYKIECLTGNCAAEGSMARQSAKSLFANTDISQLSVY